MLFLKIDVTGTNSLCLFNNNIKYDIALELLIFADDLKLFAILAQLEVGAELHGLSLRVM